MKKKKIYFPISIESSFKEIKVADNIWIKRIDDKECQAALGIIDVSYEFKDNGLLSRVSSGKKPRMMFAQHMPSLRDMPLFPTGQHYNFVLVLTSIEDALSFHHAVKLINPAARTSASLGFNFVPGGHIVSYMHPASFYGKARFNLHDASKELLLQYVARLITLRDDQKLSLILQKYLYSLDAEDLLMSQRFLELTTILEMLLLPDKDTELRYRFSLRLAKLLNSRSAQFSDIKKLYETAKRIYDIRSTIVHSGNDKRLNEYIDPLIEYSQHAILHYMNDADIFSDKNLDNLCLR